MRPKQVLNKLRKTFRANGYHVDGRRDSFIVRFSSVDTLSFWLAPSCREVLRDGVIQRYAVKYPPKLKYYIAVRRSTKDFLYQFPAIFPSIIDKLFSYGLLDAAKNVNVMQSVRYYFRSKRKAYKTGFLSWFFVQSRTADKVSLSGSDGHCYEYTLKSFTVLFTAKPKYPLLEQLKLFS